MEDNFYEVSSERLFPISKEQQLKQQKEQNEYERERPLITSVMKYLEREISRLEKVDSIKCTDDPEVFMREVKVNQEVCKILRQKLGTIKTKVRQFDKKKKS